MNVNYYVPAGYREVINARVNAMTDTREIRREIRYYTEVYNIRINNYGDEDYANQARYRVDVLKNRYNELTA